MRYADKTTILAKNDGVLKNISDNYVKVEKNYKIKK